MNPGRSILIQLLTLTVLLTLTALTSVAAAQEPPPEGAAAEATVKPQVEVTAVRVSPAQPTAETLCQLEIDLRNGGDKTASQLAFTVTIEGKAVDVYDNQIFMFPVAAGETATLKLFNFWVEETHRPAPTDGKLDVEVRLDEAEWFSIEEDEEGEVWEPLGAVPGLPAVASTVVTLAKAGSADAGR